MGTRPTVPVYRPIAVRMRRRRWVRASIFALLSLIAVVILLDQAGCFGYRGDDWAWFDRRSVVVTNVTDACTVTIRAADTGRTATVRLLGTDTPPATAAPAATAYAVARLLGKTATLRLDALEARDTAGNLLAFLYLTDADVFNVDVVHDGFAYSDRRVNHLLRALIDGAESDARKHHRGLWQGVTEAEMPAWRQKWLRDMRDRHREAE